MSGLECGHVYHDKCIDHWFKIKKKKSCPLCRKTIKNRLIL